jgi:RNA polymerase sigma-70 factor (ECF subfamily)
MDEELLQEKGERRQQEIQDPDEEVVERCLVGDSGCYKELVEKYHEQIISLIYRLSGDYHQAQDIAQEVFVSAYFSLKKFKKRSKFFTYLYQIALNKCRDYLKNIRRTERSLPEELSADDKAPSPVREVIGTDSIMRIQKALDSLPYEYREAFILRHIENLSYNEMKNILGASVGALKVRIHRAREMLMKLLR